MMVMDTWAVTGRICGEAGSRYICYFLYRKVKIYQYLELLLSAVLTSQIKILKSPWSGIVFKNLTVRSRLPGRFQYGKGRSSPPVLGIQSRSASDPGTDAYALPLGPY